MGELNVIADEAERALLALSGTASPDRFHLRSVGSILHDFYTAVEDIFEMVAQDLDGGLPSGPECCRRLLNTMSLPVEGVRPGCISKETATWLNDYLSFRQVFRNVYGHRLEWQRMKPLLEQLPGRYGSLKQEISEFTRFLAGLAQRLERVEPAERSDS